MAIDVGSANPVCCKCGTEYDKRAGNFFSCNSASYKGYGFIPVCKKCLDDLYATYLAQSHSCKSAIRQICRKYDLFWDERAFESVYSKTVRKNLLSAYFTYISRSSYYGKCYDDTLKNEGTLWDFGKKKSEDEEQERKAAEQAAAEAAARAAEEKRLAERQAALDNIDDRVVAFWGTGYTPEMYEALEQRRTYWMSRLPSNTELDIGAEAIIRQICSLELDINRDRAAGKSVDKSINALNTLLGSASLKPAQKKEDIDKSLLNTPMGVWIDRFESKRPLPDIDDDLKDKGHIAKYMLAWVNGHLAKMFGVKNANTQLYDEEIEKYRVERPDLQGEDDDDMMYDILSTLDDDYESQSDSDAEVG